MKKFISKFIDFNAKELKKLQKIVDKVNDFAEEMKSLSDDELKAKTPYFKNKLSQGESLDDILPEAFAVIREADKRVVGMYPYDVQVLGGIALHQGRVTEMRTGEGKTVTATMPVYLNALQGKGVHVVTVNDYLAKRDSEWVGNVYRFLGLSVGLVIAEVRDSASRRQAYNSDITFGTNNEYGFDYLRDNMAVHLEDLVQRDLHFALIDEVDSILIDEARTPLIISGPQEAPVSEYRKFTQIARVLKIDRDYEVDEKARSVTLTEVGIALAERKLGVDNLYEQQHMELSHKLNNALRAKELMKRDRDYIVKDNEIIIVDDFTGRLMIGRRYSDGLHQAIEAKEGVKVEKESRTLATITLQNYFRMYEKLAGMTGTAKTEEDEIAKIYGMDVVVIPTNKPMIRDDMQDQIYRNEQTKFNAVIRDIIERNKLGQPVLVGTVSIEKSELLGSMLKKKGVKHKVLNAKYHEQEAEIVKDAGQKNTVTIATNMAGRGTDIELGEGVKEVGGLHVIGTERHESRRIDNQLRGRSGRQGDPGSSQFYTSLEDDLMRLFASDTVAGLIDKLGMDEDVALEHKFLDRAIERAQERVEGRNYGIRKSVLEYDNIMNKQREVIYAERRKVLENENLKEQILAMISDIVVEAINTYCSDINAAKDEDFNYLQKRLNEYFPTFPNMIEQFKKMSKQELQETVIAKTEELYNEREQEFGSEIMRRVESIVMLRVVDRKWMDHIDAMTRLRQGISLRAYGGKDPLMEYQSESYNMFQNLISEIKDDTVKNIFHVQVQNKPRVQRHITNDQTNAPKKPVKTGKKIGRNDPCPCGSGKKYKKCCGK
ncbi:preprotein translocase subunit SecA [Clostridium sp. 'deep sea']|uniref:preprotein translocase subunit SecA n=1 Tax=Clostridium sp. 'deep sea' TaxID=2779445 RepID=UPI001896949D|nr:preprotein translocase subunit SecA [Clostridium sp. 'deep sea']QOR33687.1 preprotein translocase subunit SecA [Clostridium sp. 'deep sea']